MQVAFYTIDIHSSEPLSWFTMITNDLNQSEELFRKIFDLAGSGMIMTDLNGKIFEANEEFCSITGYTPDEILTLTVSDLNRPMTPLMRRMQGVIFSRGK